MFDGLPRNHYRTLLADPPWRFESWSDKGEGRSASQHYGVMSLADIAKLPVADVCADDCVLLMWATWPMLPQALDLIAAWGFIYKTCGFDWMKADGRQVDLFAGNISADMKMGYWTRSNSEPCLLATRGKPERKSAAVRMGIIEPARQHSRKPDCVHERIERLVDGPYLELFARQRREGWSSWGNEVDKFKERVA